MGADAIRRDADAWVAALPAARPRVAPRSSPRELSRYVVDLNRDEGDVDEWAVAGARAEGAEHRRSCGRETGDGRAALRRPLTRREFQRGSSATTGPYHRALAAELMRLRGEHRDVVLVAAHLRCPRPARPPRGDVVRHADVVPGTRGKTTRRAPSSTR